MSDMLRASLAALLLSGCAGVLYPVKHATPGGITIVYDDANDGRFRLSPEKAREVDARWRALLECLPPEALCRTEPPQVQIRGGNCDSFVVNGRRIRGGEYFWGRAVVPGSLGALAHEMTHHATCEVHGNGPYAETWMRRCGDEVDKFFRRMYPPPTCKEDR